jgi:hypothetical protein
MKHLCWRALNSPASTEELAWWVVLGAHQHKSYRMWREMKIRICEAPKKQFTHDTSLSLYLLVLSWPHISFISLPYLIVFLPPRRAVGGKGPPPTRNPRQQRQAGEEADCMAATVDRQTPPQQIPQQRRVQRRSSCQHVLENRRCGGAVHASRAWRQMLEWRSGIWLGSLYPRAGAHQVLGVPKPTTTRY